MTVISEFLKKETVFILPVKFSKNNELLVGVFVITLILLEFVFIWLIFRARIFKTAAKAGKIYKHNAKYK